MKRPAPDKVMGRHGDIVISTGPRYAAVEVSFTGIRCVRAPQRQWERLTVKALIAVTVTLALSLAPLAASAQQATPPEKEERPAWDTSEQFPPAWEKALRALGDDTLYLLTSPLRLTPESALVLGGIGAGVAGLALADRSIRSALAPHRHDGVRDAADDVALLGNAGVLFGLNVGAIAIGEGLKEATGNSKLLDAALVATEAQLLTAAFTEGIAYGTGRARPGQSNDPGQWFSKWGRDSFPSSHTSQTFAVAAVIEDRFGLGPGIVAYGLAGMVGAARLVQDKHWASDVAGGAALGWAVGHYLSRRHSEPHQYLDFFPFADPRTKTYGLVIEAKF